MKKHNKSSHKSVALVYNDALPAPVILAKGRGLMAERIDSIAKEAGVPFAIDQALAEGLEPMDVGTMVPPEYWEIIAKILIIIRNAQR